MDLLENNEDINMGDNHIGNDAIGDNHIGDNHIGNDAIGDDILLESLRMYEEQLSRNKPEKKENDIIDTDEDLTHLTISKQEWAKFLYQPRHFQSFFDKYDMYEMMLEQCSSEAYANDHLKEEIRIMGESREKWIKFHKPPTITFEDCVKEHKINVNNKKEYLDLHKAFRAFQKSWWVA